MEICLITTPVPGKAIILYCNSAQEKFISSFYRVSLAFGVAPLEGLSYTMLVHFTLLLERIVMRKDRVQFNSLYQLILCLVIGSVWIFYF